MSAWNGIMPFKDLVEKDQFVTRHLSVEAIRACFDPKAYIREVGMIFKRVFGKRRAS